MTSIDDLKVGRIIKVRSNSTWLQIFGFQCSCVYHKNICSDSKGSTYLTAYTYHSCFYFIVYTHIENGYNGYIKVLYKNSSRQHTYKMYKTLGQFYNFETDP